MEKFQKILKNKYFYYILIGIMMLCLSVYDLKYKLNDNGITSNKYIIFLAVVGSIILSIIILAIRIKEIRKIKMENMFSIIALILGSMYLICAPIFTGSDDHSHFYRIYEITEGTIITPIQDDNTVGSELPKSLSSIFINNSKKHNDRNKYIKYKDEIEMIKVPENKDEKVIYGTNYETQYTAAALYSPVQYIPQILGVLTGKVLKMNPFIQGQLARVFNLLAYVGICSYFIKRLPKYKEVAFLILLCPNLLASATTFSADAFTCALVFGLITIVINNINSEEKLTIKSKILIVMLSVLISSCKIVYFPFVLLLCLIPKERFKGKGNKIAFIGACIVLSIIVSATWMKITGRYFDIYYKNSDIQKNNILANMLKYAFVVLRTYLSKIDIIIFNTFGGNNMYHSQLPVYNFISVVYFIIVSLGFFSQDNKIEKNQKNKIIHNILTVSVMLIVLALISTAIYVQCTANFIKIDNPVIGGLQGRYFIPLVLCALLIDHKKRIEIIHKDNKMFIDIGLLLNTFILFQMIVCFCA